MQIHTAHRDFKDGTPEAGAVLGLLSGKLDIGTYFDKFRQIIRGYVDIKFDNSKDVMCVVTYMEDAMQFLKREKQNRRFRWRGSKVHPEEEKTRVSAKDMHK